MNNGITYDPTRQSWIMQCGSTAVPIQRLDTGNKPIPAPASGDGTRSRANVTTQQEKDHAHLRTH